jgi:hypothetical protein
MTHLVNKELYIIIIVRYSASVTLLSVMHLLEEKGILRITSRYIRTAISV